jgi:hypothetical protein
LVHEVSPTEELAKRRRAQSVDHAGLEEHRVSYRQDLLRRNSLLHAECQILIGASRRGSPRVEFLIILTWPAPFKC